MRHEIWHFLWPLFVLAAVAAVFHAVLYKREPQSALAWVAVILLSPVLGPLCYFLFGLNRVKRKAALFRTDDLSGGTASAKTQTRRGVLSQLESEEDSSRLKKTLRRVGNKTIQLPLEEKNSIRLLTNGDEAYPVMLEAIAKAQKRIFLSTYIFANDALGRSFVNALADAQKRGVEVKVLVDDIGARYSFPTIAQQLKKSGLSFARFLRVFFPWQAEFLNLRLHRKCIVIDGRVGFVGGMNIASSNLVKENPRHPVRDLHFFLQGPVVRQCERVFADDWFFSTKEKIILSETSTNFQAGSLSARFIADGPDSHAEKTTWTILAALAGAEKTVRIMTPYFFPDQGILMALSSAALRGVAVDIVLPQKNNLPWFEWASTTLMPEILEHGCRVWLSNGPFTHSKLFVVDEQWALIGSSNWDQRSLKLNFELNLECFDGAFAVQLEHHIDAAIRQSKALSLQRIQERSFGLRLRDGAARLFGPII